MAAVIALAVVVVIVVMGLLGLGAMGIGGISAENHNQTLKSPGCSFPLPGPGLEGRAVLELAGLYMLQALPLKVLRKGNLRYLASVPVLLFLLLNISSEKLPFLFPHLP